MINLFMVFFISGVSRIFKTWSHLTINSFLALQRRNVWSKSCRHSGHNCHRSYHWSFSAIRFTGNLFWNLQSMQTYATPEEIQKCA